MNTRFPLAQIFHRSQRRDFSTINFLCLWRRFRLKNPCIYTSGCPKIKIYVAIELGPLGVSHLLYSYSLREMNKIKFIFEELNSSVRGVKIKIINVHVFINEEIRNFSCRFRILDPKAWWNYKNKNLMNSNYVSKHEQSWLVSMDFM